MSTKPVLSALVLAAGMALSLSGGARAASEGVSTVAEASAAVRPASVAEGEDDAGTCSRIRRRLFVEGEGWIVRRITTCR